MKSGWTVCTQLFLLMAALALPLLALVVYNAYGDFSSRQEVVAASGRSLAEITAAETSSFLHDTQIALASLSQRPLVRALDPQRCDPALRDYLDAHPYFANVLTVDVSGRVVCSVVAVPSGVSTIPRDIWLDKLIQTEAFTLGKPSRGLITGRRVVVLAYPLRNRQGKIIGGVGLPIDLAKFAPLAGKIELPPETSVRILSGDGTIIASLSNPQAEVGRNARGSEIADIVLARKRGEARALGTDGIERIYAFLPISGVDWYAYAGIPVSVAFAEFNQRTLESAVVGLLIVLLALSLALAAARRVTGPMSAIGETAAKIQGGDRDARFRLEGPAEIAQVLAQFNRTLDALAEDERRRRESERRYSEMIGSVAEGIISIDEQQRIVVFNAAAERMFGRSAAQVVGEPINTLLPERFRARHQGHIRNFAATGQTNRQMGGYGLIYGLRANGEEFPVEATVSQSETSPNKLLTAILRDITERRQAEEAQAFLATIVETSNDAIISRSLDRAILSWNAAAERIFGYTADEVIGQNISLIIPPDREEESARNRALLAQGHALLDLETVRLAKGGRRIDVSLSQSPIKDERGAMVGAVLTFRDISQRVQANQMRAKLAAIVENANEAIISRSLDGTIETWNAAAQRLLGYTAAEAVSEKLMAIQPLDRQHEIAADWEAIRQGKEVPSRETVRFAKNGRRIDVSLSVSPIHDAAGKVVGSAAFIRDIGERKQAEQALRESEARFRSLTELTSDGYWEQDEQFRFTLIGGAAASWLQDHGQQLIGKKRWEVNHINMTPADWAAHIATLEAHKPFRDLELCYVEADGNELWVSTSGEPVFDDSGIFKGYRGATTNITERRVQEETLRRFRIAVDASADMVLLIDPVGVNYIDVNDAACRALGYSREELVAMGPCDLFSETRERLNKSYDSLIKGDISESTVEGWYRRKDGSRFPVESIRRASSFGTGHVIVAVARDITERKQAEERIQYLTQYDAVTGLPNRLLLQDRLKLAMARDRRLGAMTGLLLLDLDRFKNINDALGHGVGDKVLQAFSARLRERLREVDTVARLGGDEFAVILEGVTEKAQAARVAEKILEVTAEPLAIEGEEIFVTPSIGVGVYPLDADSVEKLLENAELAMYRAKEDGRNTMHLYVTEQDSSRGAGIGMESRLRRAVERDELLLNFQPKVDLRTGAISGAEALLRWRNPDLGLVSPADFIPLAEETGLIVPIGEWVLHRACAQAAAWQREGYPLTVAVNLSARQFRLKDLCEMVRMVLADTGLAAGQLELEITESMIMRHPEQTIATLKDLRDIGVTLSVDDFGTGYSSLSYLKRFPVHTLKVDQSFVREAHQNNDDAAIVRAVIALAKSLNLKTIAEGVETEQQLILLAGLRCDEYQGYYFSRPLPAAEFLRLLQNHKAATSPVGSGSQMPACIRQSID